MSLSEDDWRRIAKGGFDSQNPVETAAAHGLFKGGDEILQYQVGYAILNADLRTVIEAGVRQLEARRIPLLQTNDVVARIDEALASGQGYALIRFGDGELLTLAQDTVLTVQEVQTVAPWLHLSGVTIPDLNARDLLAEAFNRADLVGVPTSRFMTYGSLFLRLASYYNWPIEHLPLTSSVVNYAIYEQTNWYQRILRSKKVLLMGNRSEKLHTALEQSGFSTIAGHIAVQGMSSIASALAESEKYDFDVALVAAGIPACVICPQLRDRGKVAIDFGHLADGLADGGLKLQV